MISPDKIDTFIDELIKSTSSGKVKWVYESRMYSIEYSFESNKVNYTVSRNESTVRYGSQPVYYYALEISPIYVRGEESSSYRVGKDESEKVVKLFEVVDDIHKNIFKAKIEKAFNLSNIPK